MPERTRHSTVTFGHAFTLAGVEGAQPAGTYTIETTEDLIDSLSLVAYRRVSTAIILDSRLPGRGGRQVVPIDPRDLEAALDRDAGTDRPLGPVR